MSTHETRRKFCFSTLLALLLSLAAVSAIAAVTELSWDWDATNRDWSGDGSGDDCARYITEYSEGYIITGYVTNGGNGWDLFVKALDSSGNEIKTYTFDGHSLNEQEINDYGMCVRETIDDGFIVVGVANSTEQDQDATGDILMIKLPAIPESGGWTEDWYEEYGTYTGGASHVIEVSEDVYVLSGQRSNSGSTKKHAMLKKVTDNGASRTENWDDVYWPDYDTRDAYVSWFSGFRQTDSGFIGAGGGYQSISGTVYGSIYLVFTDSAGENEVKHLTADPDNNSTNKKYEGRNLTGQVNNGYVITGHTHTDLLPAKQAFLWRIPEDYSDESDTEWYQEYGDCFHSAAAQNDYGWAVQHFTESGNIYYAMTGFTVEAHQPGGSWNAWLMKADANGSQEDQWACAFGNTNMDVGYSVYVDDDGVDYYVAGYKSTTGLNPHQDVYVIITDGGTDEDDCQDCSQ